MNPPPRDPTITQTLLILLAALAGAVALLIVLVPAADYAEHEPTATTTDTCHRPTSSCQRPASDLGGHQ